MIRIWIYYSSSEKYSLCFWSCFFEACGIWVSEKPIDQFIRQETKDPIMFLVGNEGREITKQMANSPYVFIGSKTCQKKSKALILKSLFGDTEISANLSKLLDIFEKQKLWGGMWLFKEIAQKGKSRFDKRIVEIASKTRKKINDNGLTNDPHAEFMSLYCKYMICGSDVRESLKRAEFSQQLLRECSVLAGNDIERSPVFYMLAGKICSLSPTINKIATFYYKDALEFETKPEVLYEIGNIYEKNYGNNDNAMEYYQRANSVEGTYFRSIYKRAYNMEMTGNWNMALKYYHQIISLLSNCSPYISIFEVLYPFKAKVRILMIYRKYISNKRVIDSYFENIKEFLNLIESRDWFEELVHHMFGTNQEKRINENLKKEILEKFNEFYSEI